MARGIVWSKIALADKLLILDYWFKKLGSKNYPKKLDREFRETIKHLSKLFYSPFLVPLNSLS